MMSAKLLGLTGAGASLLAVSLTLSVIVVGATVLLECFDRWMVWRAIHTDNDDPARRLTWIRHGRGPGDGPDDGDDGPGPSP